MGLFSRLRASAAPVVGPESVSAAPDPEALRLIEQGNASEDAGRSEEALGLYEAALRLSPELARAHLNRGNALLALGTIDEALASYASAIERDPNYAAAYFNSGNAYLRSGQHDAAIEACRKALALKPDFADAEFALGCALEAIGQPMEAAAAYRRALEIKSEFAEVSSNLGNVLNGLGQLEDAVASYRRALDVNPSAGAVHRRLGDTLGDLRRFDEAAASYQQALRSNVDGVDVLAELGRVQQRLGRFDDAVASFRLLLETKPDDLDVHLNLGNALKQLGKSEEAIASYERALAINPDYPEARFNLGVTLQELDRFDAAVDCYQRVLRLAPNFADAHLNLGNALRELGRRDDAVASYRNAIAAAPGLAIAHGNLGNMQRELGEHDHAVASYRRALAIDPSSAELHFSLGTALKELRRFSDSVASFSAAIRLQPDHVGAHMNLGSLLRDGGHLEEAEAHHRRALEIDPYSTEAHNNLANTLKSLGRFDEAMAHYRRAVQIKPDSWTAHSNVLLAMNYAGAGSASERLEAARNFGRMIEASPPCSRAGKSSSTRPEVLRVGLVSGDFRSHPVGYFLEGLLKECRHGRLDLIAYPTFDVADETTAVLRPCFSAWKPLTGLSDEAAAALIRADGVHVLLDLSGHTAHNRLPIFAWKPAAVQASWLGYFATTGVAQIDYVLGDPYVTPAGEENQFTEQVWRLPESYLCFTPPDFSLDVGPLPALASGRMTFGCFNNLDKMNDEVVALWSRVLRAVPGSRLFLKTRQLNDANVRATTLRRFAAAGVAENRLLLEGPAPRRELLAAYGRADVALDPFPYPGGTTTVEGYWMGVPAITRRGDRFLSRVGETIAHNVGLSDWIAADDDHYVAKAVAVASNLEELASLRGRLRPQALASPLFDARRFAHHLEAALWGMWESTQDPKAPFA